MRLKPREISVVITRPGYFTGDDQLPPVADLPLPPNELLDLLEKARIHDPLDIYTVSIDSCRKDYIQTHLIDQPLNILELNHLANILADMDKLDEDVFEGYMKMWKEDHPAPVHRIINLALSAVGNPMAYGISNDEQLGKMSFENDFFEELLDLPDDMIKFLDYAKLGKERRIGEGGVYTGQGYIPMLLTDEEINSHYAPGSFPQLEDLLPSESLQVQYYRYDLDAKEPCEGSVTEVLPISTERYQQIKEELGATDEELTLITRFCIIPSLQEYISETEPIGNLNALAVCLDGARAMGKLPLYKALLEAAECQTVEIAAELGCQLHEYRLDTDITEAAQYARKELEKHLGPKETARMAQFQDLCNYGRDLAESNNVVVTDYGYLRRCDGDPILEFGEYMVRKSPAVPTPHSNRDQLVARSNRLLEQNYRAYMAQIAAMDTEAIFEEAATIAVTKLVFDQLTDPTWPDDLYEAILHCKNPLYEARDHWLEHGQPAFNEGQFSISMEDFVDRNAQTPEQQMYEQSQ